MIPPELQTKSYSILPIDSYPSRRAISELFKPASIIYNQKVISPEERQAVNISLDELGSLPGIKIISLREFFEDNDNVYRCVEFAFGRQQALTLRYEPELWNNTGKVLRNHGYKIIDGQPQKGDIVVYGTVERKKESDNYLLLGQHFGVYNGIINGKHIVLSKFGSSHVLEHDIDMVPIEYGNVAFFYRRHNPQTLLDT